MQTQLHGLYGFESKISQVSRQSQLLNLDKLKETQLKHELSKKEPQFQQFLKAKKQGPVKLHLFPELNSMRFERLALDNGKWRYAATGLLSDRVESKISVKVI